MRLSSPARWIMAGERKPAKQMSAFNVRFKGLDVDGRRERYHRLAAASLAYYLVQYATITFLQHNGGIAYRIDATCDERYVLKIIEPAGEGNNAGPERAAATLAWVAALARETDLVIQEPIPNRQGGLVTAVTFDDLDAPFHCSLQRWVDGEHVEQFTPGHVRRVGVMAASLHRHGRRWVLPESIQATELAPGWVSRRLQDLRGVVDLGILSGEEWKNAGQAAGQIDGLMAGLGRDPSVWGLVHGDLHHGNLLFHGDEVRLIDFGGLTRTHTAYDLGTLLYHVMYQDSMVRRALVEGYGADWLSEEVARAFVCAAAIDNLAFQITLPQERTSKLFTHNVRELVSCFCKNLLAGTPFVLA